MDTKTRLQIENHAHSLKRALKENSQNPFKNLKSFLPKDKVNAFT